MDIIEGRSPAIKLLKMLFLSVLAFFAGPLLLYLGYRRLKAIPKEDANYLLLKWVLIVASVIYLLGGSYMVYRMFWQTERGEDLERVEWLQMDAARNVSFYRTYSFTAYEFEIGEEDFLKEFRFRDNLGEIVKPLTLQRYNYRTRELPSSEREVTIHSGLFLTSKNTMGRYFTIAYDRERGRVFYQEGDGGQ